MEALASNLLLFNWWSLQSWDKFFGIPQAQFSLEKTTETGQELREKWWSLVKLKEFGEHNENLSESGEKAGKVGALRKAYYREARRQPSFSLSLCSLVGSAFFGPCTIARSYCQPSSSPGVRWCGGEYLPSIPQQWAITSSYPHMHTHPILHRICVQYFLLVWKIKIHLYIYLVIYFQNL